METISLWQYLGVALAGYLIGSFPTGVVLSKRKYRIDVRDIGSGNIGATNITRVFGWGAGVFTLVVDTLKAAVPLYFLNKYYGSHLWLVSIAGMSLVLGHCYSVYLKFSGGKGVATSLGCIAVLAPYAALAGGLSYAALLAITRISAVGSLVGLFVVNVAMLIRYPRIELLAFVWVVSIVVIARHKSNIERLVGDFKNRKEQRQEQVK